MSRRLIRRAVSRGGFKTRPTGHRPRNLWFFCLLKKMWIASSPPQPGLPRPQPGLPRPQAAVPRPQAGLPAAGGDFPFDHC